MIPLPKAADKTQIKKEPSKSNVLHSGHPFFKC